MAKKSKEQIEKDLAPIQVSPKPFRFKELPRPEKLKDIPERIRG